MTVVRPLRALRYHASGHPGPGAAGPSPRPARAP